MTRGFRLAAVERLRAGRLAERARILAAARAAVGDAVGDREALADRLLTCVPEQLCSPEGVRTAAARREQLRERLVAADARLEEARRDVAGALAGWMSARAELRAVEVLHERHRETLRREDLRRDQLQLDELAAARARRPATTGESA